jgi:NAD-dependent SIR2 family protein deacetylase
MTLSMFNLHLNQELIVQLDETLQRSKNIEVITGAGISVASDIARFRKNNNAVWETNVTEKGTWHYFKSHPVNSIS